MSPSEVESAFMCSHRAALEYHHGQRYTTLATARGTAVHAAAAHDSREKLDGATPSEDELVDVALTAFEAECRSIDAPLVLLGDERGRPRLAHDRTRGEVARLTRLYKDACSPFYAPTWIERRLFVNVPESPVDLCGQIDAADDHGIVDWKTAKRRKRSQHEVNRSVQLTFYGALYRAVRGDWPERIELYELYLRGTGADAQRFKTVRDAGHLSAMINRVNAYVALIEAGITLPAPEAAWWCSPGACAHWNDCIFVRSSAARRSAGERKDHEQGA